MAKLEGRDRRKARIRKRISGTSERPRLSVFRSARHIYAQVVDDTGGGTLAAASTLSPDLKGTLEADDKTGAAKKVGALIAKMCLERKVGKVVFDRNGFLYHGRIKALAEAAREAGLDFLARAGF
jgi:large subunit ribosomal protein L18